ncbi:helix-turn-helix domain-containing protein [Streptomyces sp. NPDC096080]|uniref:helix-turn-helix domain-containing protein n=1 Tax=Streptomyces sp. NPDC096080 TaxID=3156693 RepID=UPI00332ADB02
MPTTADEPTAVAVPASLAAATFNALLLYLGTAARTGGGALTPDARTFLRDLHRAASGSPADAPPSSQGSTAITSATLGAHEVADQLGCSRRWATALLGSGRIRATRAGRTWVTTQAYLDAFRYGHEESHEREGEARGERRESCRPAEDDPGTVGDG